MYKRREVWQGPSPGLVTTGIRVAEGMGHTVTACPVFWEVYEGKNEFMGLRFTTPRWAGHIMQLGNTGKIFLPHNNNRIPWW